MNNTIRLVELLHVLSPMRPAQQIQSIALTKPRSTKLTLGNDRLRYAALSPRAENVHRLGGRAANEKKNSKRKEGGTEGERTAVLSNFIQFSTLEGPLANAQRCTTELKYCVDALASTWRGEARVHQLHSFPCMRDGCLSTDEARGVSQDAPK